MKIQCPNCNALTSIHPKQFYELNEFYCSACGEITFLKNGSERIVKIQFVLTEPELNPVKNNPEETVETFHQVDGFKQPSCSSQQLTELCEEQHEGVQLE
jgi:oligoribonuclease (3'-5' exoribonuclease)